MPHLGAPVYYMGPCLLCTLIITPPSTVHVCLFTWCSTDGTYMGPRFLSVS